MSLVSNLWYEITYTNYETLIFQFLDLTDDGQARCRLCNNTEVIDIFNKNYLSVSEIGKICPC